MKVAAEDIEVIEAEARTWPDASLGCPGRRRQNVAGRDVRFPFQVEHAKLLAVV